MLFLQQNTMLTNLGGWILAHEKYWMTEQYACVPCEMATTHWVVLGKYK